MSTMRWGSLILALLLLGITGAVGYVTVERVGASRDQVWHTYQVGGLLKDLRADIGEAHANFDLFQLSRNPNEAAQLELQIGEQTKTLEKLLQLTHNNATQQERLLDFQSILHKDFAQLRVCAAGATCLEQGAAGKADSLAQITARRETMYAMLRDMEGVEDHLLVARLQDW